jgi:hypothetical protein
MPRASSARYYCSGRNKMYPTKDDFRVRVEFHVMDTLPFRITIQRSLQCEETLAHVVGTENLTVDRRPCHAQDSDVKLSLRN